VAKFEKNPPCAVETRETETSLTRDEESSWRTDGFESSDRQTTAKNQKPKKRQKKKMKTLNFSCCNHLELEKIGFSPQKKKKKKDTGKLYMSGSSSASYDEVDLEDMEWNEELKAYTYSCPCGDIFRITLDELHDGEEIARCPSCSLILTVIYDPDELPARE
jgi:diphthamide biosynthesis protein 3